MTELTEKEAYKLASNHLNAGLDGMIDDRFFIESCVRYSFGWYFRFGVRVELIGGPDFGVLINKQGDLYPLHYVGTSWDILSYDKDESGRHPKYETMEDSQGIFQPTKYTVRYFLKQMKMKNLFKSGKLSFNKSFRTSDDYNVEAAVNCLKCSLCVPRLRAFSWITNDSGIKICNDNHLLVDREFDDKVTSVWGEKEIIGLRDENWEEYFNSDSF